MFLHLLRHIIGASSPPLRHSNPHPHLVHLSSHHPHPVHCPLPLCHPFNLLRHLIHLSNSNHLFHPTPQLSHLLHPSPCPPNLSRPPHKYYQSQLSHPISHPSHLSPPTPSPHFHSPHPPCFTSVCDSISTLSKPVGLFCMHWGLNSKLAASQSGFQQIELPPPYQKSNWM